MTQEIMTFINDNIFGVWFLIGAALVFWMQAGFAMVEAGFTRAKNTGNILMKNLMDFLYWYCNVHPDWIFLLTWRRCVRIYWKTGI